MLLVIWVVIGAVIGLVYLPFVYGIEGDLANNLWGLPVVYFLFFFLWPAVLAYIVYRRIRDGRSR